MTSVTKRIFSSLASLCSIFPVVMAILSPAMSHASPINYSFNFSTGPGYGQAPGQATFTYDTTTHLFSNFLIPWHTTWAGWAGGQFSYDHTFDFTNTANTQASQIAPLNCPNAHTPAEAMFAFLSQEPCAGFGQEYRPWSFDWEGRYFSAIVSSGPAYPGTYYVRQDDRGPGFYPLGGIHFYGFSTALTVVSPPVEIPEPGMLVLLGLGLSAVVWTQTRRKA